MVKLLLASSSITRAKVLNDTTIPFATISPDIDESFKDRDIDSFVLRVSAEKAKAGWKKFTQLADFKKDDYYVLGADQIAVFENNIYGKPKTKEKAQEFLEKFSSNSITYLSGLSLYHPLSGKSHTTVSETFIKFKELSSTTIAQYIKLDNPLYCAGALKIESMGTSLIESYQCSDPTAITGLPLIALNNLLAFHKISLMDFYQNEASLTQ